MKKLYFFALFAFVFIISVHAQSNFPDYLYSAARESGDFAAALAKNEADVSAMTASYGANGLSVSGSVQGGAGLPVSSSSSLTGMKFPISAEIVLSLPQFTAIKKYRSLDELVEEFKLEADKSALNSTIFTIIGTLISYYKASVNLEFYEQENIRAEQSACIALGNREEELCTSLHRTIALQNLEQARFTATAEERKVKEFFDEIPENAVLEDFIAGLVCDYKKAPVLVLAENEDSRAQVYGKILEYRLLYPYPRLYTSGSISPPDITSLTISAGVRLSLGYDPQSVQYMKSSKNTASYYSERLKNTLHNIENQIQLKDAEIESLMKQAELLKTVKDGAVTMGEIAKDKFESGSTTMTEMFSVYSNRDAYKRDYEILLLNLLYAHAEKAFYCGAFGNTSY